MSLCQHGQKITQFCLSETCNTPESGGCQSCLKKYHNHQNSSIFIKQSDLNDIVTKFGIDHRTKPKCRVFQEAIYNYVGKVKAQFANSLDSVCKAILNQVGYPFLCKNKQLQIYKRLKNKQYKKVSASDLRKIYQVSCNIQENMLLKQQTQIYFKQVDKTISYINQLNQILQNYGKLSQKIGGVYKHEVSSWKKVQQIGKNISNLRTNEKQQVKQTKLTLNQKKSEKQEKRQEISNSGKQKNTTEKPNDKKINLYLAPTINSNNSEELERVPSIDMLLKKKMPQRQKNMSTIANQQKIKNQPMLTKPEEKQQLNKKNQVTKSKDQLKKPKTEIKSKQVKQEQKVKNNKQLLVDSILHNKHKNEDIDVQIQLQKPESINNNSFNQKSSNKSNEQRDYALRNIPREKSQKRLFGETQDIIKKTIFVPVLNQKFNNGDNEEQSSPLFKAKKMKTFEMEHSIPKSEVRGQSANKSANNSPEKQKLKQNEQKSLALLIKSIGMKAQEAIPHLQSALRHAQNNLSAGEYLSFLLLEVGRPRQCLNLCNKILKRLQNSTQYDELSINLNNNKAASLNLLGRYSQAIKILEKILINQEKYILYKNLGDSYFSIGIYEKAILNYEKTVGLFNQCDEAYYNLSVCYFIQQNFSKSKNYISKALEIKPRNNTYAEFKNRIFQKTKSK